MHIGSRNLEVELQDFLQDVLVWVSESQHCDPPPPARPISSWLCLQKTRRSNDRTAESSRRMVGGVPGRHHFGKGEKRRHFWTGLPVVPPPPPKALLASGTSGPGIDRHATAITRQQTPRLQLQIVVLQRLAGSRGTCPCLDECTQPSIGSTSPACLMFGGHTLSLMSLNANASSLSFLRDALCSSTSGQSRIDLLVRVLCGGREGATSCRV